MKKIILSIIVLQSYSINCQEITKKHFDVLVNKTKLIANYLKSNKIEEAELYLKLSPTDAKKLKLVLNNDDFKSNSTYTHPHFLLTENPKKFKMIITSFKVLEKLKNENFSRGIYFFVIESIVSIDQKNQIINYEKSMIFTEDTNINKWWLSQFKTYVNNTKKVYDKFGYTPPPPPCPPKSLK